MSLVNQQNSTALPLRRPQQVMRLSRLGSFHQTRLSFMRVLLRRLRHENWQFSRTHWDVDRFGVGVGVYTATGPDRSYSLVAFANNLDPSKRSDRVIAEEWDATFTLFDGVPDKDDIERLAANVPVQEAGRVSGKELSLSRANRSVRLFEYVREKLAGGEQPDPAELDKVGYLMRTTAVYGSGKFGASDRQFICDREEFKAPFQSELLTVFMIREFSINIVEHIAQCDNPSKFTPLDPSIKRRLGIGNSTGLGMAPFIVNHPTLLNNWILARETALARVRAVSSIDKKQKEKFIDYLQRQIKGVDEWQTAHEYQAGKIAALTADLNLLATHVGNDDWSQVTTPWNTLFEWAEQALSLEGQECLVSLLLELYPQLVDDLSASMSIDETQHFRIDGRMSVQRVLQLIESNYEFASGFDVNSTNENARFWYASEEKLEPRLGERFQEEGAEREHPLATARDVMALLTDLIRWEDKQVAIAEFLLKHPDHRHSVRRVQQSEHHPYSEIADNLIAHDMLPIDVLRCKLSFFGAVKFDPRSDRWVRITMYQHAPNMDEISAESVIDPERWDDWVYPTLDE